MSCNFHKPAGDNLTGQIVHCGECGQPVCLRLVPTTKYLCTKTVGHEGPCWNPYADRSAELKGPRWPGTVEFYPPFGGDRDD